MHNLFKRKHLFGMLYAFLIGIPIFSILSKCVYVAFNKNAFESYGDVSTLEGVFEYSLKSIVGDSNYGVLDFTSWFSSMFLVSNDVNNLYIGFVNWYLNFVLFVSLIYILFLVLIWFVNFSRNILESSMNRDFGGRY